MVERINMVKELTLQQKAMGMCVMFIVCMMVVLASALKRRADWLIHILFRTVMGILMIYGINSVVIMQNEGMCIGYNPATILTSGILGFPGVLALYGMKLLSLL